MLLNNYYNMVSFFSNNPNDVSGVATTFVGAYEVDYKYPMLFIKVIVLQVIVKRLVKMLIQD